MCLAEVGDVLQFLLVEDVLQLPLVDREKEKDLKQAENH